MRKICIFVLLAVTFLLMSGCDHTNGEDTSTSPNEETHIQQSNGATDNTDTAIYDETIEIIFGNETDNVEDTTMLSIEDIANKSWDFEKYLEKWVEVKKEIPSTNCKVFVRGKELQNVKYAHIFKDENSVLIPLISIFEEVGATVEWYGSEGDERAAILNNDTLYILYVQYASLFNTETEQDYFFGVGGNTRPPEFAFIDNEFLVDGIWGSGTISEVLDMYVYVDYDSSCIYVYDKGTTFDAE